MFARSKIYIIFDSLIHTMHLIGWQSDHVATVGASYKV